MRERVRRNPETISPEYKAILSLATRTPQVVDDLWLAIELGDSSGGIVVRERLKGLLNSTSRYDENWDLWFAYHTREALSFLTDPDRYPDEIYQALKARYLKEGRWQFTFDKPDGFRQRSGFLSNRIDFEREGQRLPLIEINKGSRTSGVFAWETANAINQIIREKNLERLFSKYTTVDGILAYQYAYVINRPTEISQVIRLETCDVIVARGGRAYHFSLGAEKIEPYLATFEQFLASIRSR